MRPRIERATREMRRLQEEMFGTEKATNPHRPLYDQYRRHVTALDVQTKLVRRAIRVAEGQPAVEKPLEFRLSADAERTRKSIGPTEYEERIERDPEGVLKEVYEKETAATEKPNAVVAEAREAMRELETALAAYVKNVGEKGAKNEELARALRAYAEELEAHRTLATDTMFRVSGSSGTYGGEDLRRARAGKPPRKLYPDVEQ